MTCMSYSGASCHIKYYTILIDSCMTTYYKHKIVGKNLPLP